MKRCCFNIVSTVNIAAAWKILLITMRTGTSFPKIKKNPWWIKTHHLIVASFAKDISIVYEVQLAYILITDLGYERRAVTQSREPSAQA